MADKKFFVDINLQGGSRVVNMAVESRSTDPSAPIDGQLWYNTATNDLKARIGGVTVTIDKVGGTYIISGEALVSDFNAAAVTSDLAASALATQFATAAAVKSYADSLLGAADALVYKGAIDASTATQFPAGNAGDVYKISVAGTIDGVVLQVGDMVICTTDGTTAGTTANWNAIQSNVDLATDTSAGIVELATVAEAEAATDTARAVTPAGLASYTRKYVGTITASTGGTVFNATHGLGANDIWHVAVYNGNEEVMVNVSINALGEVTWSSNVPITGKIVIIG